jgi:tRNA(Ile)-lysidine synthase
LGKKITSEFTHGSTETTFEETIAATIVQNCPPGTVIIAAVSGGADSTAMLAALVALRDTGAAFSLRCIHVEHGIRPQAESRGDAALVKDLCQKLNVPCRIVSVAPGAVAAVARKRGIGIEAAARLYRHKAWFREARRLESGGGPVRILTAHTADDMCETVLMRILRGSGPCGLAAMPVSRGRLLRPLLRLSRSDVLAYLKEKGISWREDSSNTDIQFLRNRVRHRLIPQLNDHFPQWRAGLNSLAETQSLSAAFIREEASRRIQWQPSSFPISHSLFVDTETFFAQPAIIREEALFQGINQLGVSGKIRRANIRRFAESKAAAVDLGSLQLRKNAQQVTIMAISDKNDIESFSIPHPSSESGFSLLINAPGSYNLKGIAIRASECPDGNKAEDGSFFAVLPLVVRPCFNDDFIEHNGRKIAPAGWLAAVDSWGIAAFIGFEGLVQRRDDSAAVRGADDALKVNVEVRGM